jgi:WD40 repeat protein
MKVIKIVPLPSFSCVSCWVSSASISQHPNLLYVNNSVLQSPTKPPRTIAERDNLSHYSHSSKESVHEIPFRAAFCVTFIASFTKALNVLVDEVRVGVSVADAKQAAVHSHGNKSEVSSHASKVRSRSSTIDSRLSPRLSPRQQYLQGEANAVLSISMSMRDELGDLSAISTARDHYILDEINDSYSVGGAASGVSVLSSPFKHHIRQNLGSNADDASVHVPPLTDPSYHYNVAVPLSSLLIKDMESQIPADSYLRCYLDPQSMRVQRPRIEDAAVQVPSLPSNKQRPSSASSSSSSSRPAPSLLSSNWEAPKVSKTGRVVDNPLVFSHTRIRSSGYGQTPNHPLDAMARKREERLKKERLARSSSAPRRTTSGVNGSRDQSGAGAGVGSRLRMYPMDCGVMSTITASTDQATSQPLAAIKGCTFSSDASCLALTTNDNGIVTLKLPFTATGKASSGDVFSCYRGHNGVINSVEFSFDKKLMISSSADGTARIFRRNRMDTAAVIFSHTQHSATGEKQKLQTMCSAESAKEYGNEMPTVTINSSTSARASSLYGGPAGAGTAGGGAVGRNKPFSQSILKASFYFQDKFVALVRLYCLLFFRIE